jgi:hypothetical protein
MYTVSRTFPLADVLARTRPYDTKDLTSNGRLPLAWLCQRKTRERQHERGQRHHLSQAMSPVSDTLLGQGKVISVPMIHQHLLFYRNCAMVAIFTTASPSFSLRWSDCHRASITRSHGYYLYNMALASHRHGIQSESKSFQLLLTPHYVHMVHMVGSQCHGPSFPRLQSCSLL